MFDGQWWADELQAVVSAIPRAQGEDQDQKVARMARFAGVSRSTLYNILAGKTTRGISVDGWIRIMQMIPHGKSDVKVGHVLKILGAVGMNLAPANVHAMGNVTG